MRIVFLYPGGLPHSNLIYIENVTRELARMGHVMIPFSGKGLPGEADIYWQPSAGRNGPSAVFKHATAPVVVTFHGAANLALPLFHCFRPGLRSMAAGIFSRLDTNLGWRLHAGLYEAVIAVSEYAKQESQSCLGIPDRKVTSVYHGLDHAIFHPCQKEIRTDPYFLHVSSYQPKKNLDRLIAAYGLIPDHTKPRLVVIAPGYQCSGYHEGLELIRQPMDHRHISEFYQNALAFIFPSLHETFGMPIVEAMACGCPVVTSNHAGCVETAGGAALIVDPYSVDAISGAMRQLANDAELRRTLREKGLERAKRFTWRKCAEEHLTVFERTANNYRNQERRTMTGRSCIAQVAVRIRPGGDWRYWGQRDKSGCSHTVLSWLLSGLGSE